MRRRLTALALLLGSLLGAALVSAGPASAHATVQGTTPSDGARLAAAPASITVRFDEAVVLSSLAYVQVVGPSGARVDAGPVVHPGGDGSVVAVRLRGGLGDGTYAVRFRVASDDGHPAAGAFRFVVGDGPLKAAPTGGTGTGAAVGTALAAVRWTSYAGLVLLAGTWLLLTVWPQGRDDLRATRLVWAGWTALVVGTVGEVLVEGPYLAGAGLGRALHPDLLSATVHSRFGGFRSLRLAVLGVVAVLLGRLFAFPSRRRPGEWALWAAVPLVALTFSATGHADTTSPRWLSIGLDAAHVTAMAAWLGGLAMLALAVLPRRDPDERAAVLPAVSRVAFGSVAVLAVTGTYAAWRGVGSPGALLTTGYGRLVLTKVVLFAVLVGLGWLARDSIRRRFLERLRRGVLVELALGVAVLAATSVLVSQPRGGGTDTTPPARAVVPVTARLVPSTEPDTAPSVPVTARVTARVTASEGAPK